MNYAEIYEKLTPVLDPVKKAAAFAASGSKKMISGAEAGNWTELGKVLAGMEANVAAQQEALAALREVYDSFDVPAYFISGDFEKQMVEACEKKGVDVRMLDAGNYEMFPYSLKISADRQEITLNRKKVNTVSPAWLAQYVHDGQEKLNKASFNVESFAKELADAYETAVAVAGQKPGTAMNLNTVYKYLAPTARARKEYDMLSYAYDIARLYNAHFSQMKDGRFLILGPGRGKAIRFLDANGNEQQYVTLTVQKNKLD